VVHGTETICSLETTLGPDWMDRTLRKALVDPALSEHLKLHKLSLDAFATENFATTREKATLLVDGKDVRMHDSVSSIARSDGIATDLVVMMPTPPPSRTKPTSVLFLVTLRVPPEGDSLAPWREVELVTQLDAAWLDKSLLDALIIPAISSGDVGTAHDPKVVAGGCIVEVGGSSIDVMAPAHSFARPFGTTVNVRIQMPEGLS